MPASVSAITRALDVLDVIRVSGGAAGVSEISRALDLPKSTVHRILTTLADRKMVYKNEDTDRYRFGYKALELGLSAFQGSDFIGIAMPHIEALRDRLDETVSVVLRTGYYYTYVARAISHREYYFTPSMGKHYPLHWAATGKSMLAFLPDDELERYLHTVPLLPATKRTVTDPVILRQQLEGIRTAGYAVSFGERVESAAAVAAPLRDRRGCAYGAVTVITPGPRLRDRDSRALGDDVVATRGDIEVACEMGGIDVRHVVGVE
jgi:IclR family acetate operon transcriptional repressor